jgi:serine protease Do
MCNGFRIADCGFRIVRAVAGQSAIRNPQSAIGLIACMACVSLAGAASAQDSRQARETPVVRVFREAKSAVVNLSTTTIVSVRQPFGLGGILDDIFEFPEARPRRYEAHSVGSGFVIHSDGYVVTNAHVIDRAAECKITFSDGTELPAEEVASDRKHDIAVLKVVAKRPLPFLEMGRSDDLMPGETVIAIGNPLGYQHTVTTGIISALDRELRFNENLVYSGLIQTDASINPGNSGGPLLNITGELIGINSAIRGDAQNIGFAIPIDRLRELLPAMLDIERLRRVRLGMHFGGQVVETKGDRVRATMHVERGVVIREVDAGSPADEAGIKAGDLLVSLDGRPTPDFMDAFSILDKTPAGAKLSVELRRNREPVSAIVALEEIPRLDAAKVMLAKIGVEVRELKPEDLVRLGLRRPVGLLVVNVGLRSEAAKTIQRGDLITTFGGWPVTSLGALGHLLDQIGPGDRIPIGLLRIGTDAFLRTEITLTAR